LQYQENGLSQAILCALAGLAQLLKNVVKLFTPNFFGDHPGFTQRRYGVK
jgi:hypothetical protein